MRRTARLATHRTSAERSSRLRIAIAHLATEEIHEHAETAKKIGGENRSILFEVERRRDVHRVQRAIDELQPRLPPPVEVDDGAMLGSVLDEPATERRDDVVNVFPSVLTWMLKSRVSDSSLSPPARS